MEQTEPPRGDHAHQHPQPRILAAVGDGKTGQRADQHHPFYPQIEHPGTLGDQFPQGGKQERRAGSQPGADDIHNENQTSKLHGI